MQTNRIFMVRFVNIKEVKLCKQIQNKGKKRKNRK